MNNPTAIGLLLDIVGFTIVFFVGGLNFGIRNVTTRRATGYVLIARIVGFLLIVLGFALQLYGACDQGPVLSRFTTQSCFG